MNLRWPPPFSLPGDALHWQHAVKLTLAGLITFFLANWLRLENPAWGVATCVVLIMPKYVGAIGEKALLRTLGNLAGAVLGVLLIGNLGENEFGLIAVFFAITAFCSWRYGSTAHPYAFLLAAVTLNRVVVPNLDHPIGGAWETATNRTLEISLGILVSTTVYAVLWPRYARLDFLAEIEAALRELAAALRGPAGSGPGPDLTRVSVNRLTKLRKLLQAGARESATFRRHFGTYSDLLTRVGALFVFAESVQARRTRGRSLRDPEAEGCVERLNALAGGRIDAIVRQDHASIEPQRREFRAALEALRARLEAAPGEDRAGAGIYLTLRHLHSQLREVAAGYAFLGQDPGRGPRYPSADRSSLPIDPVWRRIAIKSTTAGCVAWALCVWLQPPGATYIPYFVWFFLLLSRMFQDNEGDRGALRFAAEVSAVGLLFVGALLVTSPWLSDRIAMAATLSLVLGAYGYFTATYTGWTRWSRTAFFAILSWLSLDLQRPVDFQAILGAYWQIVIATWFAAFVGRIWWPILPHWEVCSRLRGVFEAARKLIHAPDSPERRKAIRQMSLLANEASAWAEKLEAPGFPAGEAVRWVATLTALRLFAYRLRLFVFLGRRNRAVYAQAGPAGETFRAALDAYLGAWAVRFRRKGAGPTPDVAPLVAAHENLETAVTANGLAAGHRMVLAGLLSAADELLAAVRAFDAAIAPIALSDYPRDASL